MMFLAMHITNQTFSFYIFKVGHLQNIFMEHDLILIKGQLSDLLSYLNDFWHKIKIYNFDPYNVFLAITTNILQRLKTGFVLHFYNT